MVPRNSVHTVYSEARTLRSTAARFLWGRETYRVSRWLASIGRSRYLIVKKKRQHGRLWLWNRHHHGSRSIRSSRCYWWPPHTMIVLTVARSRRLCAGERSVWPCMHIIMYGKLSVTTSLAIMRELIPPVEIIGGVLWCEYTLESRRRGTPWRHLDY